MSERPIIFTPLLMRERPGVWYWVCPYSHVRWRASANSLSGWN